ncbi:JmjC domain-containing protein [Streptomyces sp. NPDC001811]
MKAEPSQPRCGAVGLVELTWQLTGAITTLFHGTYEHSPVGFHKDRFATFLFGLRGRKRMRFWPRRPWDEPVSTKTDYARHIAASVPAEVGPGELLYWPADYYHVGGSATAAAATSVNVGIPRDEHHTGYELEDLLADLDPARVAGRGGLDTLLGTTDGPPDRARPRDRRRPRSHAARGAHYRRTGPARLRRPRRDAPPRRRALPAPLDRWRLRAGSARHGAPRPQ